MSLPRPPRTARLGTAGRATVLVAVGLLLAGCNLAVGVDVVVRADGSGELQLGFRLDEELASSLEADGFDPAFGLAELEETGTAWRVDVDRSDGVTVRVTAPFTDQAELDRRVAELDDGIDLVEDGGILEELAVSVAQDGRVTVTGRATLVIPATTGATGDGIVFDGDDLRAFLDEHGTDVLLVEIRFQLPGPVLDANADVVEGSTATWQLSPGETRELSAAALPASDRTGLLVAAVALIGLVGGFLWVIVRRR